MPTLPGISEIFQMLTVNAKLGPPEFAVIAVTILVVKTLKANPNMHTPKHLRPWFYLGVGILCNVGMQFVLGTLAVKTIIAQQAVIWFATLGIRHVVDAVNGKPSQVAPPREEDSRRP